ncbi:MAG TPA: DUF4129 domain-containing protein, partial [Anaerolineaceae bacterium]
PWGWAVAVLAAAGLAFAAISEGRARRLLRLPAAEGLYIIYNRLARAGFPRGERGSAGLTPYETSARLAGGLHGGGWLGGWIRPAKGEIEALVGLYVQSAYSPREVTPREFRGAFRQWRRLQLRLTAAAVVRFLKK